MKLFKYFFLPIVLSLLVFSSCTEQISPVTKGVDATITGIDMSLCACCGGYLISLDETAETSDLVAGDFYQWNGQPEELREKIDGLEFPISVKITYEVLDDNCSTSSGWIDISKLKVK